MADKEVAEPSRTMVGGRNLPLAIGVGLVLAAIFLGSLFGSALAFTAVVVAFASVACVEVARVLRPTAKAPIAPVLVATSVLLIPATAQLGPSGQAAGTAALAGGTVLWMLFDRNRTMVLSRVSSTVLFGLWLPFLASFAMLLRRLDDGAIAVLIVIGAAIFTDIGGYAFGVAFGKHKVAPQVSPNKSWEGLIGGLVVAGTLAAVIVPMLTDTITPLGAIVVATICGVAGFIGDLFESMIKRDLDIKDLGALLPGHGGVLDRVDGILFALPVGYYTITTLNDFAWFSP